MQTWTRVATPGNFVNGIHFFDGTNGWLLADPVGGAFVILLTSDGGWTWHAASAAPPAGSGVFGLAGSFTWPCREIGLFGTDAGLVWRTTDGGESWNSVPIGFQDVYSLAVNERGIGYAGSGYSPPPAGDMARSSDFGANWVSMPGPNASMPVQCLSWVPHTDHIWAASQSFCSAMHTYRSTNLGSDWTGEAIGTIESYVIQLSFGDANTGWAVGWDWGDELGRLWKFVPGDSQENPALPDSGGPSGWFFADASSGSWFDPPLVSAYRYTMATGSLFQSILDFPTGFSGPFTVTVDSTSLGEFLPGDTVDLGGVAEFEISGIQPGVDPGDPTAFPLKLAFTTPRAGFTMMPALPAAVGPASHVRPDLILTAPNPSPGSVAFRFTNGEAGAVRLEIFDASGRSIRTLSGSFSGPGRHEVSWDGRDSGGGPVTAGAYSYRLMGAGVRRSGQVVIVR